MKNFITAGVCAATLLCAGSAMATLYEHQIHDTVYFGNTGITSENGLATLDASWGNVSLIGGPGDHAFWTHNYEFNPDWYELIDAQLTLTFQDDNRDCWFKWEVGVTLAEDGLFDWNEIDTGDYTYDVDLNSVGDGSFQVGVVGVLGDFYLTSSTLDISYNSYDEGPVAPVPEPATMVLFGVGLGITGLTSIRRKMVKK